MDRLLAAALIVPGFVFLGLGLIESPATHGFGFWGVMYGLLVLCVRVGPWMLRPGVPRLLAALVPTLGVFAMIAAFSFLAVDPLVLAAVIALLLLLAALLDRPRDRTLTALSAVIAFTTLVSGWVA